MASQRRIFTRIIPLLALLLCSVSPAPASKAEKETDREIGHIVVGGSQRIVYAGYQNGVKQKYFLDAQGKRVDLAAYQREAVQDKRRKYGTFGARLFDTLSTLKSDDEVDVNLTFRKRSPKDGHKDGKLTKTEANSEIKSSFMAGINALERQLGALSPEETAFRDRNSLRLRLRKSELLALKDNAQIQSIELRLDPRKEKILRQAILEESFLGAGWNSGGLHFSGGHTNRRAGKESDLGFR